MNIMRECPDTGLPMGQTKPALGTPHFPTKHQAVIWRNWNLLTPVTLARVLATSVENVVFAAGELGLGSGATSTTEALWRQRGYITLIRQNWHLLPYTQLLELLDWSPERLSYTLKEDDFLWNKLGALKPLTEAVRWTPLTEEQRSATAALRELVEDCFGGNEPPKDPPFGFLDRYGSAESILPPSDRSERDPLRMAYSYSAVYGDPLLNPDLNPYPDGLLSDFAANGINAVWLQGVLYTLVPWFGETEYSEGCATRLANLNRLVERAAKFGIKVYLYINEPRSMPASFFAERPSWRGSYRVSDNRYSMCASDAGMLKALRDGIGELFRQVPRLGGLFTITMSENLTHCYSKPYTKDYPACQKCLGIPPPQIIADINNAIAEGALEANPKADIIAWSWGWNAEWGSSVLPLLDKRIRLMCTQEGMLQSETAGIRGRVLDYTMSRVGPGYFAEELWQYAKALGLERVAKIQMNITWECSAVPYLPVPFTVNETLQNLKKRGIRDYMVSWTLGGYPGGNLPLIGMTPEQMAEELYGSAAPEVIRAWRLFCEAFTHFPLHSTTLLYRGPQNYGPMAPLYASPTGYDACMIGFPYDDLEGWRGILFPEDVFEDELRRLAEGWHRGLETLKGAEAGEGHAAALADLLLVSEATYCHFRSAYLQALFVRLRDAKRTPETLSALMKVLDEESELARRLCDIVDGDSRIGFEASNHYFYTRQSLREKVLNCEQVRKSLRLEG